MSVVYTGSAGARMSRIAALLEYPITWLVVSYRAPTATTLFKAAGADRTLPRPSFPAAAMTVIPAVVATLAIWARPGNIASAAARSVNPKAGKPQLLLMTLIGYAGSSLRWVIHQSQAARAAAV